MYEEVTTTRYKMYPGRRKTKRTLNLEVGRRRRSEMPVTFKVRIIDPSVDLAR